MMNGSPSARYARVALAIGLASLAGAVSAATIKMQDEDPIQVTSYSTVAPYTNFVLQQPLLCGNTSDPTAAAIKIRPSFGNFLFGTFDSSGNQTQFYAGVAAFNYSTGQPFTLATDGSLNCYAVTPAGVRKFGTGLFSDPFDSGTFDSKIAIRVMDLPTAGNSWVYTYFIDVTIPTVPVTTRFEMRDGFDKSIFDYTLVNWCEVDQTVSNCGFTNSGNVVKAYTDFQVNVGTSYTKRFIVKRKLKNTVFSVPNNGNAAVLAALFVRDSLPETTYSNNVAAGSGALSDLDPTINTTGTNLTGFVEGGGAHPGISFVINDDTTETGGNLLGASVNVNFNGSISSVPVDCGSLIPLTGPVQRTCTFSVTPPTANFATGGGVTASVQITVTDPHGQHVSTTLPLFVTSTDNDALVYSVSALAVPDASNNNMPTLTCSLGDFTGPSCNGNVAQMIAGLAPGPSDAVDELASQTTNFVPDTSTGGSGNINCVLDSGSAQIFTPNGKPQLSPLGAATNLGLTYILRGDAGSATCTIVLTDAATSSFPGGQVAQTASQQFRILVTNPPS